MASVQRWLACGMLLLATGVLASQPDSAPSIAGPGYRSRTDKSAVLVTVNGTAITQNQVEFYRLLHPTKEEPSGESRRKLVEQLVDNELMRQFLIDRRVDADPKRLAAAVETLKGRLRRRDLKPEQTFRNLGYTDAALRRELMLPLAWESYLGRLITQQSIRDEFERHRDEYDGTEVRASQIFIKAAGPDADSKAKAAEQKLKTVRAEIASGKITFAEAARRDSEAPSAAGGGDVGFFPYRGTMPVEISRVVFPLKVGEISQPVRTPFGVHLYTVAARRPGNLSLEDVRSQVIRRLAKDLWDKLLGQARAKAKIEWATAP